MAMVLDAAQYLQPFMVGGPPAAATASPASFSSMTSSTDGFLAASMSPWVTSLSIVHWVRVRSKPSFTDQIQFLVSCPQAYSTASRLLGRRHHDRNDLVGVAVDRAVGLDH